MSNNTNDAAKVRERYNKWSEWYPYIYGSIEKGINYFHSTLATTLRSRLPAGRVLDVGCGVGLSTGGLVRAGFAVTGVDISEDSIARARQILEDDGDVYLVCANILEFEPDKHFDAAVVASGFLEHFLSADEQQNVVSKIVSFVRPGGFILIDCYNQEALMQIETDRAVRHVTPCETNHDEFVFLEMRRWRGTPRSKQYDVTYYQIRDDEDTSSITVPGLAVTFKDMEGYFKSTRRTEFSWVMPSSSGYHKYIGIARVLEKGEVSPSRDVEPTFNPEPIDMPKDPSEKPSPDDIAFPEDLPPNPFEEAPEFRRQTLRTLTDPNGKQIIERYQQVTLVMLSGGIDSVYALVKLLRESKDEIIAHHINFVNLEGRTKPEHQACRQVVDYLRAKERDFFYTESLIDRSRFKAFGGDDMAVSYEVGIVTQAFFEGRGRSIDRWTAGICMEEELEDYDYFDELKMEHMLNAAAAGSFPADPPRFFQL